MPECKTKQTKQNKTKRTNKPKRYQDKNKITFSKPPWSQANRQRGNLRVDFHVSSQVDKKKSIYILLTGSNLTCGFPFFSLFSRVKTKKEFKREMRRLMNPRFVRMFK